MQKLLLMVCALFGVMACTQEAIDEQTAIRVDAPETIKVGFEDDETRIQLNSAQKTVWTKEDLVSVFYRSDANQKWQYQGETGERVGNLKRVEDATATTQTTKTVVVYPYSKNYWLNTDNYAIDATLPATQYYAEGSYGVGSNLMVSQSEFTQFSLKSVCGWLKLQLTGNGEVVKSIKFSGNNGEQVAGLIYVDTATAEATLASEMGGSDNNNAGGNLVFDDTIITEVVLDCSEGVELGAEATAFYIALPPQTFENGFTVEIEAMDGHIMTKSTDKTHTIERNHIQPMTTFDFAPSYPLSNEIFYTASEQVTPTNPEAFGTTFISSSWDAETGTGVMLFEDELSYIGDYAFEGNAALLSVLLPNSVAEIRNCCFRYCNNLTKAVIPGEITYFHSASFEQCHALATINCRYSTSDLRHVVMNNIYLAYAPAGAEDCVIPEGVKHVESYVFRGSNIASVVIPASVNNIGEQAFLKSANLMAVYCKPTTPPAINASVNGGIFDGNASGRKIYVPKESVWAYKTAEHWSDYADAIVGYDFENGEIVEMQPNNEIWYTATQLVEPYFDDVFGATLISNNFDPETGKGILSFDGDITSVGGYAFCYCDSLTSVTIGDSVTEIGDYAFYSCSSLTSVTIGDSVTTIGYMAFYYCYSLASVTIQDSVTTIGADAFTHCSKLREFNGKYASEDGRCLIIDGTLNSFAPAGLTEYTIPDSVTSIGERAFNSCSSLTSVTIPDSVTTIGDHAFWNCYSLTSVTIPDSVTTIGWGAFSSCSSLTSVTIGDSVTTIGYEAFYDCRSLTSVTIGDSVTTIGDYAFKYCSSLTSVYCKALTPPAGDYNMFYDNASGRKIYVPTESVEAYKSAKYWRYYADAIVGYNF